MKFTRFVVPVALIVLALFLVVSSSPSSEKGMSDDSSRAVQTDEGRGSSGEGIDSRSGLPDGNDPRSRTSGGAAEDPSYDLSPRYEVGQRVRYLVVTRSESRTVGGETERSAPSRYTAFSLVTIETIAHDESGTELELTYDRIRTRTRTENFNMDTDSKLDTNAGVESIPGSYRRVVGEPVTILLDESSRITSVESELSDYGVEPDMYAGARYMLLRDGIRHHLGMLVAHSEDRRETGMHETWTRYLEPYRGPTRKRWVETEHTLLEVDNAVATVSFTGYVQSSDYDADAPDPSSSTQSPNLEGTYSLSLVDGWLIEADVEERAMSRTGAPGAGGGEEAVGRRKTTFRRVPADYTLDRLLGELAAIGRAEGPRPSGAENIDGLCERVSSSAGLPAIGASRVNSRGVMAFGMHGVRNSDGGGNVRTDDLFNLGFVSSSMLSSAIGAMVDDGLLSWDMRLPEPLASDVHESYGDATLELFLRNRAGVVGYNSAGEEAYKSLPELTGEASSQRVQALRVILSSPPPYEPGTEAETSAASLCAAVVIAEHATGRRWKDLFHEYLLGPLSMRSARFGWPATGATADQPLGHLRPSEALVPIGIGEAPPFDPLRRPAVGLSMTLADLSRYVSHELAAMAGESELISRETARFLHESPDGARSIGWFHGQLQNGLAIQWNRSVVGGFVVTVILVPELGLGSAVVANAGDGMDAATSLAMEVLYRDDRMEPRSRGIGPGGGQ